MYLTPYLFFNGQCEEAFKTYERVLGGRIVAMMKGSDAPPEAQTDEWNDRIMHARLELNGSFLMGSDTPVEYYEKPQGYFVSHGVDTPEEAERIFAALSEGGNVISPLEPSFFASRFGMLADRFGTRWMILCENRMG